MALLDLPEPVKGRVEAGELAPATACEIGKLDDPAEQAEVAALGVSGGLSRSAVVEAVRERPARSEGRAKPRRTSATVRTPDGFKVAVEHRKGLDDSAVFAGLRSALAIVEARAEGRGEAA